jgi:DNA-binding CsgD family transcriptional regulator
MWWFNINAPFGCFLASLALHFGILVSGIKHGKNPWILIPVYLPSLIFVFLWLNTPYFHPSFVLTEWGWDVSMNPATFSEYLFIIYFNICLILGAGLVIRWKFTAKREIERRQANSVILPYLIGAACVMLCPYFLYIPGMDFLNMVLDVSGQFMFIYFLTGIRFSVNRYSLMMITPNSRVGEIISGLSEPVFLVGFDGKIIFYNRVAGEMIDIKKPEWHNSIFKIFDCPVTFKKNMDDIFSGKILKSEVRCSISTGKKELRSFSLNMQSITNDETSESSGVLIFLKEDMTIGAFKNRFKITDRQLDIIFMVLSGISNRLIAEKFSISERTVENHLFNIYNKIGIDSKIELYNIAQKYNLIPN